MFRGSLGLTALALLALSACGDDPSGADAAPAEPEAAPEATPEGEPEAEPEAEPEGEPEPEPEPEAEAEVLPPEPWDPTQPGFYGVGYRAEEISYAPPGQDEPRTLRVVTWYPTLDKEGEKAVYGGILPRDGVFEGASVAIDAPAPVLVFSHGSTSFAEQSFFMTEFFTSHGWIVVAMDHTGNLFRDRGGVPPEIFALRPLDVTAVIDHITTLPDDDPLADLISDKIALSGHSFGGYTTLAVSGASFRVDAVDLACDTGQLSESFCGYFQDEATIGLFTEGFLDPRVGVSIPQAPFGGSVFGQGVADIDIPVLLFTAAGDITLLPEQDGEPIWAGLDGQDDLRVDFTTGGHFTFSNACGFGIGIGVDDGCGPTFISPERAFHAVNTYSMVFARRHLLGDMSHQDILDGTTEVDGDVLLHHKR